MRAIDVMPRDALQGIRSGPWPCRFKGILTEINGAVPDPSRRLPSRPVTRRVSETPEETERHDAAGKGGGGRRGANG